MIFLLLKAVSALCLLPEVQPIIWTELTCAENGAWCLDVENRHIICSKIQMDGCQTVERKGRLLLVIFTEPLGVEVSERTQPGCMPSLQTLAARRERCSALPEETALLPRLLAVPRGRRTTLQSSLSYLQQHGEGFSEL